MTTQQPVALVTGTSSGIGQEAARALGQAGFAVVGTSRRGAPVNGRSDRAVMLQLDVTSDESVKSVVKEVIDRFGRIDVLVNNAGITAQGSAEENSVAQVQQVFEVNVFGVIRMAQAVLPHMRARGSGRIVNVSSVLGFIPRPYGAVYAATKHAVEGWSESADHEVREFGVRILLVEPAFIKTGFEAKAIPLDMPLPAYADQRERVQQALAASVKDGGDPATVAKAIVKAATARSPRLRYAGGRTAGRIRALRRFAPSQGFDRQIRKLSKLAG